MKEIKKVTTLILFIFWVNSLFAQNNDTLKRTIGIVTGIQNAYATAPMFIGFSFQNNKHQMEVSILYSSNETSSNQFGIETVYSYYPNKFKPYVWPRHIDFRIDNSIRYLIYANSSFDSNLGIYTGAAVRIRLKKMIYFSIYAGMGILNFYDDYHTQIQYSNNFKISLMFDIGYFKWKKSK